MTLLVHSPSDQSTHKQSKQTTVDPSTNGRASKDQSRFVEQKVEELRNVLASHKGDRLLIVMQDFPDPDALSSAWAFQLIAQEYEIHSDIVYAGMLSHQENIALVRLTGLPVKRWSIQGMKEKDLTMYGGCVFVDNQGTTTQLFQRIKSNKLPVVSIIDHHSNQGNVEAEFKDLRPQIRATATILTQYLKAGLLQLDTSEARHVKCATALMHGLRADTNNLLQAQDEDFQAAAYLSRFYDSQLLSAVLQASRSKRVMDVIERALHKRFIQNSFSIAGVGYLRSEDRDAIPQAADFLVTEENIHTAVVYGIVHDDDEDLEIVVGSLRTNKITLDPDEFIKEAFGQDLQGRYFGGGRSGAGGFEIPMGFLYGFNENDDYAQAKWKVFDVQIKQKLLHLIDPSAKLDHVGDINWKPE
ncbi:MAG: bifunctional oligoribonuclease/PAP phosphatase NrnA [Leptolyngbyaceae bacterium]|nr:bifunctional oligoribonuclease/PAP phosphatase NrnA [Leptolyngbyaceae bacterium]